MADEIRDNSCNSCHAPARFWGNVVLIALAHVALITGLIRWSVAAKASSNPESIVWLGGAGNLSADETEEQESPSPKQPVARHGSSRPEQDETAEEKPAVKGAKSEIELPTATPKSTAMATPAKATPTPSSKENTTPKPIPKPARNATHSVAGGPTPKKTLVAKASPKPLAKPLTKPKPSPAKANARSEKKDKIVLAKKDSAPQSGSGKPSPDNSGQTAVAGTGSNASEFGWYGNM